MKRYLLNVPEPSPQDKVRFMEFALEQAQIALELGEIPVGAVIVRKGEVIALAHNRRETDKNALGHAEILAIDRACRKLGGWRLWECDLYVSLEPCIMCAGAIVNSRIRKVFWGARDPKAGAFGGKFCVNELGLCHKPKEEGGLLAERSSLLLKSFFERLRNKQETHP